MRSDRERLTLLGLALLGISLVVVWRAVRPEAPPLYEGIVIPPPYKYCSPPSNLASSNVRPSGGQADLAPVNGVSKLGTVETTDADGSQVIAFFAQGVFKISLPLHVSIRPRCTDAPPPPPHSALVGNDYLIQAYAGSSPDPANPPALLTPAQVLLRVPPLPYNTVRVFYDGSWHDTQFGAQTDLVNISLDHLGDIAAFNDASLKTPPKSPPPFNYAAILEALLTVIAVLTIAAGIIARRRRDGTARSGRHAVKRSGR
jgi:hypothetical protein